MYQSIYKFKMYLFYFFSHESFKVGCDWSRAAFGPGGRLLAVGAADGAVYIWDTLTGRLQAVLKDHVYVLLSNLFENHFLIII